MLYYITCLDRPSERYCKLTGNSVTEGLIAMMRTYARTLYQELECADTDLTIDCMELVEHELVPVGPTPYGHRNDPSSIIEIVDDKGGLTVAVSIPYVNDYVRGPFYCGAILREAKRLIEGRDIWDYLSEKEDQVKVPPTIPYELVPTYRAMVEMTIFALGVNLIVPDMEFIEMCKHGEYYTEKDNFIYIRMTHGLLAGSFPYR